LTGIICADDQAASRFKERHVPLMSDRIIAKMAPAGVGLHPEESASTPLERFFLLLLLFSEGVAGSSGSTLLRTSRPDPWVVSSCPETALFDRRDC
jgi:hypothetical protein